MLSLNIKHVQYVKIYLPCKFEVNLITHLGVIALFSSIFFKILILFVLYFKNYKRYRLSLNCKKLQHVKIYIHCNFEVNPITHFGVVALFSSKCSKFNTFILYLKNYQRQRESLNCKNVQHVKIYKKCPTVENVRQLCEELFLLKCIFLC